MPKHTALFAQSAFQATRITFNYVDAFPNALELEVQMISGKGATAFEVERDMPTLDLRGMF